MDKVTKGQFMAYERVRQSGVTNMSDTRRVSKLANLGQMTVHVIMKNYISLSKKFL